MANVGLPGTSGFVGEFLTLVGVFQVNTWVALVATSGVIFSAGYALWLYRRVVLGDLIKESLRSITDMTRRERLIFAPLVVMTLLLGVYPALVLDMIGPSVAALIDNYDAALAAFDAASQVADARGRAVGLCDGGLAGRGLYDQGRGRLLADMDDGGPVRAGRHCHRHEWPRHPYRLWRDVRR
jgi:hypothetical protein